MKKKETGLRRRDINTNSSPARAPNALHPAGLLSPILYLLLPPRLCFLLLLLLHQVASKLGYFSSRFGSAGVAFHFPPLLPLSHSVVDAICTLLLLRSAAAVESATVSHECTSFPLLHAPLYVGGGVGVGSLYLAWKRLYMDLADFATGYYLAHTSLSCKREERGGNLRGRRTFKTLLVFFFRAFYVITLHSRMGGRANGPQILIPAAA